MSWIFSNLHTNNGSILTWLFFANVSEAICYLGLPTRAESHVEENPAVTKF